MYKEVFLAFHPCILLLQCSYQAAALRDSHKKLNWHIKIQVNASLMSPKFRSGATSKMDKYIKMKTMCQKYHFKAFNQFNLCWFHICQMQLIQDDSWIK